MIALKFTYPLRFPGCSRNDLCGIRLPDDLPEKVRPLRSVPQPPGGGTLHPVAGPGLRVPPSPLRHLRGGDSLRDPEERGGGRGI